MNSPQITQQLKALRAGLQQLPASPWSNITNWATNARPIIGQSVPQHIALFDRMVIEPTPSTTEIFPGGNIVQYNQFVADAIARAKQTPEFAKACANQKQAILFFVDAAIAS